MMMSGISEEIYGEILTAALKALPAKYKRTLFETGCTGEAAIGTAFACLSPPRLGAWLRRWFRALEKFEGEGKRQAYGAMRKLIPYRYAITLSDGPEEVEELLALRHALLYINLRKGQVKVVTTSKGVMGDVVWRLINNPPRIEVNGQ